MKIGLIDVDGHNFPNLPLMKLSAWHKAQGDTMDVIVEDFGIEWIRKDGIVHKADFDDLIDVYEKQMPKKPYIEECDYGNAYFCLICETFIHYVDDEEEHLRFDYCPNCGQKIDWQTE